MYSNLIMTCVKLLFLHLEMGIKKSMGESRDPCFFLGPPLVNIMHLHLFYLSHARQIYIHRLKDKTLKVIACFIIG